MIYSIISLTILTKKGLVYIYILKKGNLMRTIYSISVCLLAIGFGLIFSQTPAYSHCEIPCGIYDDAAELDAISLDIDTIEKAMNQINELSKDPKANMNQITRWVNNKDDHANKIKNRVAVYFLSQRLKEPKNEEKELKSDYLNQLVYLHRLTVAAMKAKQTTDLEYITDMRNALNGFKRVYLKP